MKATLTNLMRTALAAAAVAFAAHTSWAQEYDPYDELEGKLIYRFLCDSLPEASGGGQSGAELVQPGPTTEGLSWGATALKIHQGAQLIIDIPAVLTNRPGKAYTLVLKFKITSPLSDGKVCLVGMNGVDDLVHLGADDRKIYIHQPEYNKPGEEIYEGYIHSDEYSVETDRWTTLAIR